MNSVIWVGVYIFISNISSLCYENTLSYLWSRGEVRQAAYTCEAGTNILLKPFQVRNIHSPANSFENYPFDIIAQFYALP